MNGRVSPTSVLNPRAALNMLGEAPTAGANASRPQQSHPQPTWRAPPPESSKWSHRRGSHEVTPPRQPSRGAPSSMATTWPLSAQVEDCVDRCRLGRPGRRRRRSAPPRRSRPGARDYVSGPDVTPGDESENIRPLFCLAELRRDDHLFLRNGRAFSSSIRCMRTWR